MNRVMMSSLVAGCLAFAGTLLAVAQEHSAQQNPKHEHSHVAQIVALDECDPVTFNKKLGDGFCKNVSLGAFTTFSKLFAEAATGHPDPKWDFEPDSITIEEGTTLNVTDEGGEPHTFTEVANFGGGFVPGLNAPEEDTVPECADGFANVAVAKTRILQGSNVTVDGLPKGEHRFQCCIHPWMRVKVEVK